MRIFAVGIVFAAYVTFSTVGLAQQQPAGKQNANQVDRRCAYLGFWGSFHLLGAGGTAAYHLDQDKFISNLSANREDAHFWYYTPVNGDATTTEWAFSKKPDSSGLYLVWRSDRGRWCVYEPTRAWGKGLDTEFSTATSTSTGLESRVEGLERRVDLLELKSKGKR